MKCKTFLLCHISIIAACHSLPRKEPRESSHLNGPLSSSIPTSPRNNIPFMDPNRIEKIYVVTAKYSGTKADTNAAKFNLAVKSTNSTATPWFDRSAQIGAAVGGFVGLTTLASIGIIFARRGKGGRHSSVPLEKALTKEAPPIPGKQAVRDIPTSVHNALEPPQTDSKLVNKVDDSPETLTLESKAGLPIDVPLIPKDVSEIRLPLIAPGKPGQVTVLHSETPEIQEKILKEIKRKPVKASIDELTDLIEEDGKTFAIRQASPSGLVVELVQTDPKISNLDPKLLELNNILPLDDYKVLVQRGLRDLDTNTSTDPLMSRDSGAIFELPYEIRLGDHKEVFVKVDSAMPQGAQIPNYRILPSDTLVGKPLGLSMADGYFRVGDSIDIRYLVWKKFPEMHFEKALITTKAKGEAGDVFSGDLYSPTRGSYSVTVKPEIVIIDGRKHYYIDPDSVELEKIDYRLRAINETTVKAKEVSWSADNGYFAMPAGQTAKTTQFIDVKGLGGLPPDETVYLIKMDDNPMIFVGYIASAGKKVTAEVQILTRIENGKAVQYHYIDPVKIRLED